jgi:uroporphyrinogen decarboxylase
MCGYTDPIMEDQVSLDLDWIDIDGPSSLKKMVEASRKKVVIRGNLDAALFGEGTKEQIEEAVKSCIEVAAPGSAYILSPGCSIPLNAPLENIGYFLDAACKYGRYG